MALANRLPTTREESHMKNRKPSAVAHVIVLAGPAIAFLFTFCVLASGYGTCHLSGAWFLAVIWSFLTALVGALWRAYRGDMSPFAACTLPERNDDRFEWETRSGRYACRRDYEEGGFYDDDGPFGHGPIT